MIKSRRFHKEKNIYRKRESFYLIFFFSKIFDVKIEKIDFFKVYKIVFASSFRFSAYFFSRREFFPDFINDNRSTWRAEIENVFLRKKNVLPIDGRTTPRGSPHFDTNSSLSALL